MRGLRTPIDWRRASGHATLAKRFVIVSEQLENIATTSQVPGRDVEARGAATLDDHHSHSHPDVFGQMIENVRVLERKRGEIIDQIRLLPGFSHLFKAVPFGTLQTVASHGGDAVLRVPERRGYTVGNGGHGCPGSNGECLWAYVWKRA
jgi:hypothetical protein